MARMSGQVLIRRSAQEVFDAVLDEPSWNPAMTSAQWLTPPPVQAGSRLRAVMGGRLAMQVEFTAVQRPRLVASRTQSSMMTTDGAVTISPRAQGTVLSWDWDYQLRGAARLLAPFFVPFAGRWERRNWERLRDMLEQPARQS